MHPKAFDLGVHTELPLNYDFRNILFLENSCEEILYVLEEVCDCLQDLLDESELGNIVTGILTGLIFAGSNVVRILFAALALAVYEVMLVRRNVVRIFLTTLALTVYEVMLVRRNVVGILCATLALAVYEAMRVRSCVFNGYCVFAFAEEVYKTDPVCTGLEICLSEYVLCPGCACACSEVCAGSLCGNCVDSECKACTYELVVTCVLNLECNEFIRTKVANKVILVADKLVFLSYVDCVNNVIRVRSIAYRANRLVCIELVTECCYFFLCNLIVASCTMRALCETCSCTCGSYCCINYHIVTKS